MITKAIVEEILSPYEARVRVPRLDRVNDAAVHTATENLSIATICTLPSCYTNLQVGDIVFVAYEDNSERKLVVLGHLCAENANETLIDLMVRQLDVKGSITCSTDVTLGDITYQEIERLRGIKYNIQSQIDELHVQLEQLNKRIENSLT